MVDRQRCKVLQGQNHWYDMCIVLIILSVETGRLESLEVNDSQWFFTVHFESYLTGNKF